MVVVEDRTNNGAGRIDELAQVHGMEQLQLGNVDHVDPTLLTQEEIGVGEWLNSEVDRCTNTDVIRESSEEDGLRIAMLECRE